jgi:tetratricopeptide (TPR) repeat protein
MNGLYNIAVADIGEISTDGQTHPIGDEGGVKLSQEIASALQASLQNNSNILIWNDNPELKRQRVQIGILDSTQSAEGLANRLHADMVISGTLDRRPNPPVLKMQMYLAPRLSNALNEVNGSFDLEAIPVTPDLEADSVKSELTRQTNLLATLALGQSNSQLGFTLEALENYLKAAELAPDSDMIQFFIGREYLFSLEREPVLGVARDAFEQKALEALQKSLQLNPQNARAYIGLGSLYLKQAKQLINDGMSSEFTRENFERTMQLLNQAESAYGTVGQLNPDSAIYGVPVADIAQLGLGDMLVTRGAALEANGQIELAAGAFDKATQMLEATLPAFQEPSLNRYLAQNYQFLGSAYQNVGYLAFLKGDTTTATQAYQKAIQQFDACIELGATSNDRIIQNDIVAANCQPRRQETEDYLGGGP